MECFTYFKSYMLEAQYFYETVDITNYIKYTYLLFYTSCIGEISTQFKII